MEEILKPVKGYEGYYEASSLGRIRTLGNNKFKKRLILRQCLGSWGYYVVNLTINGRSAVKLVHRLIAEAFLDNPENKPFVDHINNNKLDNNVSNLRFVTRIENANNVITKERMKKLQTEERFNKQRKTLRDRKRTFAPKTVQLIGENGKVLKEWDSAHLAGHSTGIHHTLIAYAARNGKKTHNMYFRYKE